MKLDSYWDGDKNAMKVLFLTNIPSPYRVEFFNLLSEKCDLTVIYERRTASDREDDWYINNNNTIKYKVHFLKGINYSNDASIAPGVVNFLYKEKYDIIVVSGYSSATQMLAITTLKLKKIPYILNVDGGIIKHESSFKRWYKTKLISGANCYLSTGKACDEFLMHYGAPKDRLKRYPFTSIRKKDILVAPLLKSEKESYKPKVHCDYNKMILSVGQPIPRKGFDILIKAMAQINDSSIGVYIVGGKPNDECRELLGQYKLTNIHFVPFMKKEKLADYYKAADLFVFPTREDIWGLVINEAMSFGLPIITTDKCNAGLELIRENGVIVPGNNEVELTKAINSVIDSEGISSMAAHSLDIIKKYSFEEMVQRHIEIFDEFIRIK